MPLKSNHVIYLLLAVIVVLFCVLIFREPNKIAGTGSNIDQLKEQIKEKDSLINAYQLEAEEYERNARILSAKADSLDSVKQKVKIKYREIYIDIANAKRNSYLDSIIRTNWR